MRNYRVVKTVFVAVFVGSICFGHALFVDAQEGQGLCCEDTVKKYLRDIGYHGEISVFVAEDADRAVKEALGANDSAAASLIAQQAVEKLAMIVEECTQLCVPDGLEQFHRKRVEWLQYRQRVYESFLAGDSQKELAERRMCLFAELQSLQVLVHLCKGCGQLPPPFTRLENSVSTIEALLDDAQHLKALCLSDFQRN